MVIRAAASHTEGDDFPTGFFGRAEGIVEIAPVLIARQGLMRNRLEEFLIAKTIPVAHGEARGNSELLPRVGATIDADENIAITTGASSIVMKKDGTILIKGTEVVIDGAKKTTANPPLSHASRASEVF